MKPYLIKVFIFTLIFTNIFYLDCGASEIKGIPFDLKSLPIPIRAAMPNPNSNRTCSSILSFALFQDVTDSQNSINDLIYDINASKKFTTGGQGLEIDYSYILKGTLIQFSVSDGDQVAPLVSFDENSFIRKIQHRKSGFFAYVIDANIQKKFFDQVGLFPSVNISRNLGLFFDNNGRLVRAVFLHWQYDPFSKKWNLGQYPLSWDFHI